MWTSPVFTGDLCLAPRFPRLSCVLFLWPAQHQTGASAELKEVLAGHLQCPPGTLGRCIQLRIPKAKMIGGSSEAYSFLVSLLYLRSTGSLVSKLWPLPSGERLGLRGFRRPVHPCACAAVSARVRAPPPVTCEFAS